MKNPIYLDYAAATLLDPTVKAAMDEAEMLFANPSSATSLGRAARERLEAARYEVAMVLGAKSGEIIFTSGGTEADNLAIFGLARAHKTHGCHLLTTPIEHSSVLASFARLGDEGFDVEMVKVDQNGVVDLEDLAHKIRPETILLSVAMANSEIGTIQPLGEMGRLIKSARTKRAQQGNQTPIHLHSDAAAAAGNLSLAVARLGVDAMSLNAAKIYGPKGSGALYLRAGVTLEPLIVGGGQEGGRRAGTENLAAAVGLARALQLAESRRAGEVKRLTALRDEFIKKLQHQLPKALINGHKTKRLAGNINFSFPGADGEDLVARLDVAGIIAATGAACAAASEEPSYVIRALGRSREQAQGSLRITLGRETTAEHLDRLLEELVRLV